MISKNKLYFFLMIVLSWQTVQTLMYFILVFTDCQSNRLGVSKKEVNELTLIGANTGPFHGIYYVVTKAYI